jgi:hypothetical protein
MMWSAMAFLTSRPAPSEGPELHLYLKPS